MADNKKDNTLDSEKYIKQVIVLVGKKKQYRDILEACRTPSSLGQIHFCMSKKMGKSTLSKALRRLIRGKLIIPSNEYRVPWQPPLYKLTDIGLRLVTIAPGTKNTIQWVIGGDNGH